MKIEKVKYKGYKIIIGIDEYPNDSPRDWENLGEMICFHRRYKLGDDHNYSVDELHELLDSGDYIYLPLYLYDHSGLTMSTGEFSCVWDSGQVGYIFVSKADVKSEWGWNRLTKKRYDKILDLLDGEVQTYDQYLRGEVYYYEIKRKGEFVDSCYDMYGTIEEVIHAAKAKIDAIAPKSY